MKNHNIYCFRFMVCALILLYACRRNTPEVCMAESGRAAGGAARYGRFPAETYSASWCRTEIAAYRIGYPALVLEHSKELDLTESQVLELKGMLKEFTGFSMELESEGASIHGRFLQAAGQSPPRWDRMWELAVEGSILRRRFLVRCVETARDIDRVLTDSQVRLLRNMQWSEAGSVPKDFYAAFNLSGKRSM